MSKKPKLVIDRKTRYVWFVGLFLAPVLVGVAIFLYYQAYGSLQARYECPLPSPCEVDFNGDGFLDTVSIVKDPDPRNKNRFLLHFDISNSPTPDPILVIDYVNVDNTFRTHVAHVNDDGNSYFVIFDQENKFQYYRWNGATLEPVLTPSSHLRNVRYAMGLSDDTGGFGLKLIIIFGFVALSLVYYSVLFITTLILMMRPKRFGVGLP
jgi:hypothetical protein